MRPVTTAEIARAIGKTDRHTQRILVSQERRHLVRRVGQRSGWLLTQAGIAFLTPTPPFPSPAAAEPAAGPAAADDPVDDPGQVSTVPVVSDTEAAAKLQPGAMTP